MLGSAVLDGWPDLPAERVRGWTAPLTWRPVLPVHANRVGFAMIHNAAVPDMAVGYEPNTSFLFDPPEGSMRRGVPRPDPSRPPRRATQVKGLLRGPGCTERPAWGAEEAGVEAP